MTPSGRTVSVPIPRYALTGRLPSLSERPTGRVWRGICTDLVLDCIFTDAGGRLTPAVTRTVSMRPAAQVVKTRPLPKRRGFFIGKMELIDLIYRYPSNHIPSPVHRAISFG